jgi:hypothetical protein
LMRPPYGATNARVNRIARGLGLVPVLWTIDTLDWKGGTTASIAAHVLRSLRPHQVNVVLQHDGVTRSPTSVAAVPRIVSGARAKGYCFTTVDDTGRPAVPVPSLRTVVTGAREAGRVPARVTLLLDRPTTRRVSVRLATASGSATSGADFRPLVRTVVIPAGSTTAALDIAVVDDPLVERVERFTLRLSNPNGVHLASASHVITITSDDVAPPPPPAP